MNRATLLLLALLATTVFACRSSEETNSEEKEEVTEMQRPPDPGPGIPPGHCRLVGTIIAVDSLLSTDGNDPCSKAPCTATVKVEQIIGYGSGFTSTFGKGSEVRVRFQYTLGPSSEIFPLMSPGLPGLQKGSKFQADIRTGPALMGAVQVFAAERYQVQ